MKLLISILMVLAVQGCGPSPTMTMQKVELQGFSVERIGVFEDDLSYDGKRGIYIITNKNSGKSYIGVSGIGISELGRHQVGKTVVSDER